MAGPVTQADRKLLWISGAIAVAIATTTLVFAPAPENIDTGVPSTYSTSRSGAQAAFLLLRESGIPIERWEQPPDELKSIAATDTTLIVTEPAQSPAPLEGAAIQGFVSRGGRLVITGPRISSFFEQVSLRLSQPSNLTDERGYREVPVNAGESSLNWHVAKLALHSFVYWDDVQRGQLALVRDDHGAMAVHWYVGKGTVIWWADPTPLTNAGLRKADNLQFFLNATTGGPASAPPRILWDEYFHGVRTSLWSYALNTPLRWLPLQLLLIGIFVLFAFSRRSGPIFAPREEARLSPIEFVEVMGGTYQRARVSGVVAAAERSHFRLMLAQRLGAPVKASDSELASLAERRLGWDRVELERMLAQLAQAETGGSTARAVLPTVQRLRRFSTTLESTTREPI